jgi:hypothetical protein
VYIYIDREKRREGEESKVRRGLNKGSLVGRGCVVGAPTTTTTVCPRNEAITWLQPVTGSGVGVFIGWRVVRGGGGKEKVSESLNSLD